MGFTQLFAPGFQTPLYHLSAGFQAFSAGVVLIQTKT